MSDLSKLPFSSRKEGDFDDYGIVTRPILPESQFGELLITERTPIIELNSSYGISPLRDITTETNGATIAANSSGEILMQTGTNTAARAVLNSAEVGRYIPGYGAELGMGMRFPTAPTGTQQVTWGGVDREDTDGFYFGYDSTGLYVARKRNNIEVEKVYQSNWNIDTLDGNGITGVTLNPALGIIYQIQFTWYGYGQILFGVVTDLGNSQRYTPCHAMSGFSGTSVQTPNLQIHIDAENNGEGSNIDVYVGGRQYSIIGKYVPKYRFVGKARDSVTVSAVNVPLITYRRKTGYSNRSIKLEGFDIITATNDIIVDIIIDGSVTGESFANPTSYVSTETGLEVDVSGTAIADGFAVWTQIFAAGTANKGELADAQVDLDIPNGSRISICARTFSAGSNATVKSCLRLREEW